MPTHSTDDDEALARILQFEEQSRPQAGHRSGGGAIHETAQELRDMELARQFAQMEMQQETGGGGGGNRRRSATHDGAFDVFSDFEDAAGPYGSMAAAAAAAPRASPRSPRRASYVDYHHHGSAFAASSSSSQHESAAAAQRRASSPYAVQEFHQNLSPVDLPRGSSDFGFESPSRQPPPRSSSGTSYDQLEYARQLQEQAFSNIRRGGNLNEMPDLGRATEDSDLELARRMQELEDIGMGGVNSERGIRGGEDTRRAAATTAAARHGAEGAPGTAVCMPPDHLRGGTADERLARYLEATGRSLRDISPEEMNLVTGQLQQRPQHPARQRFQEDQQDMTTVREIHVAPTERPAVRVLTSSSTTPSSPRRAAAPYPQSAPTTPVRSRNSSGTTTAAAAAGSTKSSKDTDDVYDVPDSMVQQVKTEAHCDTAAVPERRRRGFLGGFRKNDNRKPPPQIPGVAASIPPPGLAGIPAAIPPPSHHLIGSGGGIPSAIPALGGGRIVPAPNRREFPSQGRGGIAPCVVCGLTTGTFIVALEQRFHPECFRCAACHERIDVLEPFAVSRDGQERKQGYHRKCFAEIVGARCAVCRQVIPANADGTVSFVKHPFFDAERMCPSHAGDNHGRRCTGCHRFEPVDDPFVDLNDAGRCVCFACCRTVIMTSSDVTPLWKQVLGFFEHQLGLPVWDGMKNIPVMIVGANVLNDQLAHGNNTHCGSSQIMTRGLCLTHHDHRNSGMRFKLPSMRYNQSNCSFEAADEEKDGFTYYEVPRGVAGNSASNVYAIMCLSGLPRDLTASILAHEALHAWVKLHPQYDVRRPIPSQVEEGCAQLISMMFLNDGLDYPQTLQSGEPGPSDAKLRQYFRFSIETDDNEIYGTGYRRAAAAYREIGIEALLMHIVRYRDFPQT